MFDTKLFYALTIYLAALFATNTLGMKTMPFLFGTHLSVSIFFMPILFLTTDIVGQVYGREISKKFVIAGFSALVFFLLSNTLTELVPWSPQFYSRIGSAFDTVFSITWRMSLASLFAFGISEYIDVVIFFAAKSIFSNFFIASTLSNIVSQALDTALFMTIAFTGVFSSEKILMMAIPWWIYKVFGGVAYTPISYFILSLLSKKGLSHL